MNKKNLGLIALFILLIAAVVLLTAGETHEEDAPLPDIRLTEIVPHSTQINADGYAMGFITLTSFADAPADLAGWGLADRVYKVKYVFERGTTLAPGESLTVYLAGKHGAKGTLRYASFGLSAKHEEHVYLYAADGRTSNEIELPALGTDGAYRRVDGEWEAVVPEEAQTADMRKTEAKLELTEIMSNNATYAFGGVTADYIELRNASDMPIRLSDYALSDDASRPEQYVFPEDAVLGAGETAIVLCTEEAVTEGYANAAFSLNTDGETVCLYNRREGTVEELAKLPQMCADEAYAKENGQWRVTRQASPGTADLAATDGALRAKNDAGIFLSEAMASNLNTALPGVKGKYDYVELYNNTDEAVDLFGWSLSDDPKWLNRWTFGHTTIAPHAYLLVYCEPDNLALATDSVLYANFRLSAGGCGVYLTTPEGKLADRLALPTLESDWSSGRTLGEAAPMIYVNPTPGEANVGGAPGFSPAVEASLSGGLYERPVTVALTAAQDAPIYYTLDGSTPDENAARYEQPIEVARTAVLRACSILPGRAASDTMTQTYFISAYHTMPILALTTDPENLFNETDGMLADGNELDREAQKRPWMKAAYRQKKKNKGYIEWYDTDGTQRLSQGMIFSCMGQYSLDMPQKSFSIRANAQFGADTFDVAAFEDRPYTSYAAFALRNGGQDGLYTRVLDGLQQRLAEQSGTSVITQAWRPVIVYINGAYWGHYNLRERIGAKMIAQHEGWKHPEFVDLLEGDGAVNQGSVEDYRALTAYVKAHDLAAEPEALAHVLDHVDVENLIDYFFFEMFVGNEDAGNIRFYRNAVEGDGKWRYVLYDLDWGLFDSGNGGPAFVMNENGMGRYHIQSNILLVKLMQVPEIRAQFLTRAGELFQTVFTTENMIALLDEMTAQIQPEMAMHFERWAAEMYPQLSFDQPKNPAGAYAYWQERIERAKNVMKKRPTRFYDMMQETFGLTDEEMAAYFGARPEIPADAI